MSFSDLSIKKIVKVSLIGLAAVFVSFVSATDTHAKIVVEKTNAVNAADFGVIKGVVRDEQGSPISDAAVAVFRAGTSRLLKQVRSNSDGSFLAKVIPGTYTVLAVAQGFNSMTLNDVQVERSAELNYGFKLERAGSGNTLPEKRIDRNSSKWRIISAQSRRSIYQNAEGKSPVDEDKNAETEKVEESVSVAADEEKGKRRGQSVVETYFADSPDGGFAGLNFATIQPVGENTEIIFAGQTGTKNFAPNLFETKVKSRLNDSHQIQLTASAKIGRLKTDSKQLGQISFQALDEWRVKDGVILVFGFDYSHFVGAGNDSSVAPRLGLQFDVDAKTRFRTAYAAQTEERDWSHVADLEDSTVAFRSQNALPNIALENSKPKLNKSRRLEFGVERVLDNNSSIEATAFFDQISGRGVSLVNLPLNFVNAEEFAPFTVSQQGGAQGVRVVYTRRFGKVFSASTGYSIGKGQKLAPSNSSDYFENSVFQNFVGQLNTDLKTGTRIKTVFRLSPQATVFAIDPFQGRFAIYDPGLSILVTQTLPTLGLPIHAEAMIDARNLLDSQAGARSDQGKIFLDSQRRILRGGISLRF